MRFLFLIAVVMACAMMGWAVYTRPGTVMANADKDPAATLAHPVQPASFRSM